MSSFHPRAEHLQMLLLREEFSVTQLIQSGTLDSIVAAFLWAMMARRASVLVAAGPRLVGKSTTLHALTSFLPEDTQFVYARGQYETFDLEGSTDPQKTYILVSEISDHTPHYLRGPAVDKLFQLLESGYRMGATLHADTPEEVVQAIKHYSVDVPVPLIARGIDLIITLHAEETRRGIRRRIRSINYVWYEPKAPQEIGVRSLVAWQPDRDVFTVFHSPDAWAQIAEHLGTDTPGLRNEIKARKMVLDQMVDHEVVDYDRVLDIIHGYSP